MAVYCCGILDLRKTAQSQILLKLTQMDISNYSLKVGISAFSGGSSDKMKFE